MRVVYEAEIHLPKRKDRGKILVILEKFPLRKNLDPEKNEDLQIIRDSLEYLLPESYYIIGNIKRRTHD